MKIKNYITYFSLAILSVSSCSESYLEDSSTVNIELNENAIRTRFDVEASVKGLYALMRNSNGIASDHMTYQELTGDIGYVSSKNSGYFVGTNGGTHIVPDGATTTLWNNFYYIISQANFLLSFEGKIEDDNGGQQSVEQLFAHAKAIRAFYFYTLLTYYSPNYGDGDQSLGIPYPKTYDVYAKLPRESVNTVVNNILTDLLDVDVLDLGSISANDVHNSFGDAAVNLLLARVYIYKKDYQNAELYAQKVLDDPNSTLLPRNNASNVIGVSSYFTGVTGEESPETLFQIAFDALNDNGNAGLIGYWGTTSTYAQNFMSQNFRNLSSFNGGTGNNADIRKTTWYPITGVVSGTTYANDNPKPANVNKYTNTTRDIVVFRKTEAIFIKAEAQYHSNPALASQTLTDWVKAYRHPAYVAPATSGTAVLDEILNQKGFEFFLEGLRFSDLKRNNRSIVKYQYASGGTAPLNTIPAGDKRFIWPIPLNEMQTNPNMVQNPGY